MGAEQFEVRRPETDVSEAFNAAVEEAQYDHGHAGYTGTIAEKAEYVIWTLPDGLTTELAIRLLEEGHRRLDPRVSRDIYSAYDDKWGPAVAIRDDETGGWIFCGLASS